MIVSMSQPDLTRRIRHRVVMRRQRVVNRPIIHVQAKFNRDVTVVVGGFRGGVGDLGGVGKSGDY